MASINTFTIVGNVTKDVELRYTPSGTPAVTFTVAVDNVYYDRDGKKHEETDFIPSPPTASGPRTTPSF
ncbi:protein of unknown function (plasmid) [Denitratisoma oestradiolicum]|uniref:Single-stranded DNA-binding protein n=1 Tax=Denitratisoma oestradiolicum TaxID=311182 RepID=A0A6S6Y1X2_9PROT|nr:single-stranded DNA-binding protein [Denitratisoma oestradiolicum]CAB1371335.1 protein of unknown function [Denitratisoma oestradiolicum]